MLHPATTSASFQIDRATFEVHWPPFATIDWSLKAEKIKIMNNYPKGGNFEASSDSQVVFFDKETADSEKLDHQNSPLELAEVPYPDQIAADGRIQIVNEIPLDATDNLVKNKADIIDYLKPLLSNSEKESSAKIPGLGLKRSHDPIGSSSEDIFHEGVLEDKAGFPYATKKRKLDSNQEDGKEIALSSEYDFDDEQSLLQGSTTHYECLWQQRVLELRAFKEEHGHCSVPYNRNDNTPLSKWVQRQRYQYKLKKSGKHSYLSDEREEELRQLGFVFDSQGTRWDERFSQLIAFKKSTGHCNVPSSYRENHQLSIWVQCQRRAYKRFIRKDPKAPITEERITRLESLGFVFTPRQKDKTV